MLITYKDVTWNYAATFLKIASSVLLFPLILKMMPSEMVGIWTILITVSSFAGLLDFGFSPSFARNITYIFSGVKVLKTTGFEHVEDENFSIDYGLLKGSIRAMRWFYLRVAIVLFLFLITLGTYYISTILKTYKGDPKEVYIAWGILCLISTYNLFTLYFEALLQGKGLVKRSKQIIIIGQSVYLVIASILILKGNGLIAIVTAQASSVIIVRWLSYRTFFTIEIKQKLQNAIARSRAEVLKAIYPNALKIGLTSFSGFLVQKSSIIIGALYLPLKAIASYGITMQLIALIAGFAGIYTVTYQPKIANLRIYHNIPAIKKLYLEGQVIIFSTYLIIGLALIICGNWALNLIGSQTQLLVQKLILLAVIISFLETNHGIAGLILLTKNEVPFFKAALLSGAATVFLLILLFSLFNHGLWIMIIAPGIAQGVYQNWKWPIMVYSELNITRKDVLMAIRKVFLYKIEYNNFKTK